MCSTMENNHSDEQIEKIWRYVKESIEKEIYTTFSRVGDWDGELYWAVNNSTLTLEGIYTGF